MDSTRRRRPKSADVRETRLTPEALQTWRDRLAAIKADERADVGLFVASGAGMVASMYWEYELTVDGQPQGKWIATFNGTRFVWRQLTRGDQ
jgi:hypothetical protein